MRLPRPRGPISAGVIEYVACRSARLDVAALPSGEAVLHDGDLQLALATAYEPHFRGFEDVPSDREWDLPLLRARAGMEAVFERALRARIGPLPLSGEVTEALRALVRDDDAPNVSGYLAKRADPADFRQFVAQRSVYHLREADPHTFGIPRFHGRAKSALVEIQSDEYGGGAPAACMRNSSPR